MKILVFTEGTATQHPTEEQFSDVPSFVPTDGTVEKITMWWEQGAQICYLTSRRSSEDLQAVRTTLRRFGFPPGDLFFRREDEDYVAVVARAGPDILIEDDCKSIGWEEVTTPKLKAEWGIEGLIVPEFGGLAHLPDDHGELVRMAWRGT
jgi:hypothetical protein